MSLYYDNIKGSIVINGTHHLLATWSLACEKSGTAVDNDAMKNIMLTYAQVSNTGCFCDRNSKTIAGWVYTDNMGVLYEDLEVDKSMALDGEESTHDYYTFTYTTTDNKGVLIDGTIKNEPNQYWIEKDDNGNLKNTYTAQGGGEIDVRGFTNIPEESFKEQTTLKSIKTHIIGYDHNTRGGRGIGQNAFSGCTNLEIAEICGKGEYHWDVYIEDSAFKDCKKLDFVAIGNYWYNSLEKCYLGDNVFYGCTNLRRLQGQDNIIEIGANCFYGCAKLNTLTLVNVIKIKSGAFNGCDSLTQTIFNCSCDFEGGSTILSGCSNIKEITFLGGDYISNTITGLIDGIKGNEGLVVRVPGKYVDNYKQKLSKGNYSQYEWYQKIADNSYDYNSDDDNDMVIAVLDKDNHLIDGYRIDNGMIETAIFLGWLKYNTRTLTRYDVQELQEFTLNGNTTNVVNEYILGNRGTHDSAKFYDDFLEEELKFFDKLRRFPSLKKIAGDTFNDCSIECISLPDSVEEIEKNAFDGAQNLLHIDVGSGLKKIGEEAFYDIYPYSITIPSTVETIEYDAFYDCLNINYTGNLTWEEDNDRWGAACLNGYEEDGIVYTDESKTNLVSCNRMKTGIIQIDGNVKHIGDKAFRNCIYLEQITIPNSVETIGSEAFYNVLNITYNGNATGSPWGALCINGYVDTNQPYLVYTNQNKQVLVACKRGYSGPWNSSDLIPATAKTIKSYAFSNMWHLKSVRIPTTVQTIEDNAFLGMDEVIYSGTATGSPWGAIKHTTY